MSDHIRQWCQTLGLLTSINASPQDAEAKLASYVPMLAERFPGAAFNRASLDHVAGKSVRGFPTYGELATWLGEWWKENKPSQAAIAGPDEAGLTAEDKTYLLVWQRRRAKGDFPSGLPVSLDTMRNLRPAAFAHLCKTDDEVRTIARNKRWIEVDDPIDVSEMGITKRLIQLEALAAEGPVQLALASLGLKMLRFAVEAKAPERAPMLPDNFSNTPKPRTREEEQIPKSAALREQLLALGFKPTPDVLSAAEAFRATHGRNPGELSPEQLRAAREKLRAERIAAGMPVDPPA